MRILFYAAAGLNQKVWDDLQDLAMEACGEEILVLTGLGAPESAPLALVRLGRIGCPCDHPEERLTGA